MQIFLILIPFITTFLGIFVLYKFQDRKIEIFRLDLSQFVYLFLLAPTLFVWLKSFLFFIMRSELDFSLSITEIFIVDTVFTIIAFVIFSAVAIHSLTKTFRLKRDHDPEFDIFHLSEYFHLWWTHIVIWAGAMFLTTFVSIVNVFLPLRIIESSRFEFYSVLVLGFVFGLIGFFAVWMSDARQANFMRLFKIIFALFFVIHVMIYFVFDPAFNMSHGPYWFIFFGFLSAVIAGATFDKYEKPQRFRDRFLHANWGNNIDLFGEKNKK
jgi:hypothetical protein